MKANEAPEKIYLSLASFEISDFVTKILTTEEEGNIEYTRTDAFIKKAAEWMKQNVVDYLSDTGVGIVFDEWNGIEDFKKAMRQ